MRPGSHDCTPPVQVFKATLNGVSPVAVKVLKDQSMSSRETFWREVALLKSLRNSNVVQFQVGPSPAGDAQACHRGCLRAMHEAQMISTHRTLRGYSPRGQGAKHVAANLLVLQF